MANDPDLTVFLGGACFNLTLPWTLSTLSALRGRGHHDLHLGRAPVAQAEGQVEKGSAWVGVKVEGQGTSLAEGRRLASPFFGPQASPPECNNLGVPPEGCWVFLPTRRASWHMASSLVPPRDPQAQTPFPSPPRARRMDFLDGARAPCGLRRALTFALGESQQRADLPSPPLAESRSTVWQALDGSK